MRLPSFSFVETDLLPFAATLLPCIFWNLEYGILCGIAANASFILLRSARPKMRLRLQKVQCLNSFPFLSLTLIPFLTSVFGLFVCSWPRFQVGEQEVGVVELRQSLDYVSAEYVKEKVMRFVQDHKLILLILNGAEVLAIDFTMASVNH